MVKYSLYIYVCVYDQDLHLSIVHLFVLDIFYFILWLLKVLLLSFSKDVIFFNLMDEKQPPLFINIFLFYFFKKYLVIYLFIIISIFTLNEYPC